MPHAFGHDVAADGGTRAAHYQRGNQQVTPEAQRNAYRQEQRAEPEKLDERAEHRRPRGLLRFVPLERRAHHDDAERRRAAPKVVNRCLHQLRERQFRQRPGEAQPNRENNRVREDAVHRLAKELRGYLPATRVVQLEDEHGGDVVDRHRADDHQRRHAHVVVQVLHHRNAENRRAAAVRRLDEFPLDAAILQQIGNPGADEDARNRGQRAVHHIFRVPLLPVIRLAHVVEQQRRQAHAEHQPVHFRDEIIVHHIPVPQHHPNHNQEEDGQRRVEAENQII